MYNPKLEAVFIDHQERFVDEPEFLIEFYEHNASVFAEVERFDESDLLRYERIAGWYLSALVRTKQYRKALVRCDEIIRIVEKNFAELGIDPSTEKWYVFIIAHRGYAKHYLKMYRAADKDFNKLLLNNPENKELKRWMLANKYLYYYWVCIFVSVLSLTINYFSKAYLPLFINLSILTIGISAAFYGLRIRYLHKKAMVIKV